MRVILDIETNGLLNSTTINYLKAPYKLKPLYKLHCIVVKDIDTQEIYSFYGETLEDFKEFSEQFTMIIGHNILDFDLRVLQLWWDMDYILLSTGDMWCGRKIKIVDTLILSKLLNPDRGGHSLKWWGKKIGLHKGNITEDDEGEDIPDVWETFTEEMLDYCVNDVELTHLVYQHLSAEAKGWNWREPFQLEQIVRYWVSLYSHYGFKFDYELAEKNLEELDKLLEDIRSRVEPRLPKCKLNKTEQKPYIPPKIQFLAKGGVSAHLTKWLAKHDGKVLNDKQVEVFGEIHNLPLPLIPIVIEKDMTLKDQVFLKQWLCELGWIPSVWKDRDLTLKSGTKFKVSKEDFLANYQRWREKVADTPFEPIILDELELSSMMELDMKVKHHEIKKPFRVPTNPSYVKNQEKEICDNLLTLGEKVDFVQDIVHYLTYKHRRSSISGSDEEKGWLNNPRILEDGRIPTPADTVGTNTCRFRHIDVCNIPRCSSLYGEKIRALFGVENNQYQLGYDGSGLEARIQGHYVYNYKGGPEFAKILLQEKPNDIHCYDEQTEILSENGWKTFGELLEKEKVAQWDNGIIKFVIPEEIIWRNYDGEMIEIKSQRIDQLVTLNHRIISKTRKTKEFTINTAADVMGYKGTRIIPSTGKVDSEYKIEPNFLRLLIATQADGHLNKDCSAITFSFTKDRKIIRLRELLNIQNIEYSETNFVRNGRVETVFRLNASPICVEIRRHLTDTKELPWWFLNLNVESISIILDEIPFWDGTLRDNGDFVFDTTSKQSADVIQALCHLCNRRGTINKYHKVTTYGKCDIYRCYISNKGQQICTEQRYFKRIPYSGKIGCVSVPSGLIVVRRGGKVCISGNTLTAKNLGIPRDIAKNIRYAAMYGATWKKLKKMLGWTDAKAKQLFDDFWNDSISLKQLKEEIEKYWETTGGKKFIKGIDGRKLNTRSRHSLINTLFQSAGVISMKRALVFHMEWLLEEDLVGDPFKDDVDNKECCVPMILYHK